jgi:GH35 family endo-1,4-beta-xylanase
MHRKEWAQRISFTEEVVRFLQKKGAPIDGLGLQSHHIESLAPIPEVLRTLDRFAALGVDLQATEYDIRLLPSTTDRKADFRKRWRTPGPPIPPAMERLEADYLRDYLTAFFSHPAVTAFVMWGFWDGKHWLHNAPLLRKDWTLKPAGEAYRDLVFKRWWTDAEGKTGAKGTFETRGFLGDYEIVVKAGAATRTVRARLERPGTTVTVALDAR